jgi:hypothetical protein
MKKIWSCAWALLAVGALGPRDIGAVAASIS